MEEGRISHSQAVELGVCSQAARIARSLREFEEAKLEEAFLRERLDQVAAHGVLSEECTS